MSQFIPLETPGGILWVEFDSSSDGSLLVSAFQDKAFRSFQDVTNALQVNAQVLHAAFAASKPSSVTVRFGVKAEVRGSSALFGLAQDAEQASYQIELVWEKAENSVDE